MRLLVLTTTVVLTAAFSPNGNSFRRLRKPALVVGRSAQTTPPTVLAAETDFFSIETTNTGPSGGAVHTLTIRSLPGQKQTDDSPAATAEDAKPSEFVPEETIVIETGKLGRQAAGAITLTRGETVLYATAARDSEPKEGIDFLPLSVEHQERFSSAGTTSGSYNKRDGRPAEHEILTCRLIDRPLRPLIAGGWRHETQLLSWVLSYDGIRSCDPLAITASATALYLSDVPLTKPVGAVMVGYYKATDEYVLNPTNQQMETSDLQLVVAGTKDAVLMIEGASNFLPEDTMIKAVTFGHNAIQAICEAVQEFGNTVGIKKKMDTIEAPIEGLQERVNEIMTDHIDEMYAGGGTKTTQGPIMRKLQRAMVEELEEEFPDQEKALMGAFKDLLCRRMFVRAKTVGVRCDGRKFDEIRHLDMEAGMLPRVHGSALFTRGETQALATATLGGSSMKQKIDKLDGMEQKRFYLQYTFPPSCVGETGRVGMPGRREVGHGNLAERALIPGLPSEKDFPYSIRVESLVTESHGSSSMASVCGGCLALMDAGVPIKSPIAGIAMGMLLDDKSGVSDDDAIILSDILGTEDALGTMDFKVAGDREGITTFQLDIKCEGLTLATMERALEQARVGRIHILDAMEKVLPSARDELPDTVPKMVSFNVPFETIGKIIGPGGKQIRQIIEDFELEACDVTDDGMVQICSFNTTRANEAKDFVKALTSGGGGGGGRGGRREERPKYVGPPAEEGKIYKGKITGIHDFGVFLEILPGAEDGSTPGLEGLCHISELDKQRIRNCGGFVKSLGVEELDVMYIGLNNKGKISLSRKAVMEGRKITPKAEEKTEPPATMPEGEMDAIAAAIEDVMGS